MKLIKNKHIAIMAALAISACKNEDIKDTFEGDSISSNSSIENSKMEEQKKDNSFSSYYYTGDILNFSFNINPESANDLKKIDQQIFKNGIIGSSFLNKTLEGEGTKIKNLVDLLAKDFINISNQLSQKSNSNIDSNLNFTPNQNTFDTNLSDSNHNIMNNKSETNGDIYNKQLQRHFNFINTKNLYEKGDYKNFLIQFKDMDTLINTKEFKDNLSLRNEFSIFKNKYFIKDMIVIPNKPILTIKEQHKELHKKYFSLVYNKLVLENENVFIDFILASYIADLSNNELIAKIYNSRLNQVQFSLLKTKEVKNSLSVFYKENILNDDLLFSDFLNKIHIIDTNSQFNKNSFLKNRLIQTVESISK